MGLYTLASSGTLMPFRISWMGFIFAALAISISDFTVLIIDNFSIFKFLLGCWINILFYQFFKVLKNIYKKNKNYLYLLL